MPTKKYSPATPKKTVTPVTSINPVKKNVTEINFSGNNFDNMVHHHFGGHGHGGGWGSGRGYGYGYPAGYLGYPSYYSPEPIIIAQAPAAQAPVPASTQTTTSAQAKTEDSSNGVGAGFIIGAVVVLIAGGIWWNSKQ
jgi:hypothetical protein